jgi:signal transduction histidine kinase/ActR/RegA family two-component response regulator
MRAAVLAGFILLVVTGLAAVVVAFTTAQADNAAAHSLQVRRTQTELFSSLQDAETGQRGYLLTGDEAYLRPFERARARLPILQTQLRALTRDNSEQQQRLDELDALIRPKMAELKRTIELAQANRSDEAIALVRTNQGRDLMRRIRDLATAFDEAERQLLSQRQAHADYLRTALMGVIILAVVLVTLLGVMVARAGRAYTIDLREQNLELQHEIAQREKAEGQLRQAQKMEALGQLTGGIAHDFNNMLAIIVGNLDILQRRMPAEDSRLRSLVESALGGANRAAALTQRLLAFSRLQPLDPKPTDVNKCVTDMSEMLRRSIGEIIAIETVLGGGLWRAYVDSPQLESAILNLAVNARDAMPEGGRLTLETSNAFLDEDYAKAHVEVSAGQYVLVAITDTGHGMSPEIIEKAFEPFFTTKPIGAGTGLGLSQVHGFLKQSRGHIKIYSELGLGTTVKLYLPRDVSGVVVDSGRQVAAAKAIGGRLTVLIVEDDIGVRTVTVSAAKELGFSVVEADSAAVALERLGQQPEIVLMLTDVIMPVMDGRRLVDAAHALRPDLRVIYMTGYTRNAIVHNGVLDAGTHLITKPFTVDQLERELRSTLADLI